MASVQEWPSPTQPFVPQMESACPTHCHHIKFLLIRRTVRRSYVHAPILRASTNFGPGPGVQFTSSNGTAVDRQNARPSKVLTTERLVFFSDDYDTHTHTETNQLLSLSLRMRADDNIITCKYILSYIIANTCVTVHIRLAQLARRIPK